jgi:hypothetical protein
MEYRKTAKPHPTPQAAPHRKQYRKELQAIIMEMKIETKRQM